MEGEKGVFVLLFFMIVVGLPVIAGVLSDAYKRRLKFRERELELSAQRSSEQAASYAASNAELEARVRVLETIVTDGGLETAAQIEALRAPRLTGEKVR